MIYLNIKYDIKKMQKIAQRCKLYFSFLFLYEIHVIKFKYEFKRRGKKKCARVLEYVIFQTATSSVLCVQAVCTCTRMVFKGS